MAIFRLPSFRRGASNSSTAPSKSGATRSAADMGGMTSRVGPPVNDTATNKKMRPYSSTLNLLKRTRTPSGHTSAQTTCTSQVTSRKDAPSFDADKTEVDRTEFETTELDLTTTMIDHEPASELTIRAPKDSVHSNNSSKHEDDSDSMSDTSSTATATQSSLYLDKMQKLDEEEQDRHGNGMTTPTPPQAETPKLMLPTPHFLGQDSPTKYGLRATDTPSPDRSLTADQRKKMTGAGLFVHATNQQKTTTSPLSVSGQADSSATQSSLSLPLTNKTNTNNVDQSNSLPSRKLPRPKITNPFKDAPQENVAHALPLKNSQRACFRKHDLWQRWGSNQRHPVACSVCDRYEAPGNDFMACTWCEMHVCGECYKVFVSGGAAAMMERYKVR